MAAAIACAVIVGLVSPLAVGPPSPTAPPPPREGVAAHLAPELPHVTPVPLARFPGLLDLSRPPAGSSSLRSKVVNTNAAYASEPAPMGIADYGVTGSLQPYTYSTTEFVATANISALKGDSSQSGTYDGFQLNDVVIFEKGHTNYTYWIQNAPDFDTSSNTLYLDDEVWNLTSASSYMSPGAVVGLGETDDGLYDYSPPGPSATYPGNFDVLPLPLTLQLQTTSYVVDGIPSVGIGYDLGDGWVVQDNLSFPFARNTTDENFVVDGYAYNGAGIFTDSEFDLVSGGDGAMQIDTGSVLQMTLQYWNGHNLQAVPNAWDFGSDTAETISQVVVKSLVAPSNGLPGASWTKGSGSLGPLYNLSQLAQVTVLGAPRGTIEVNGTATPYVDGSALLTLAPGTYTISQVDPGNLLAERNVTVREGEVTTVDLHLQSVTVQELGLPSDASWSVAWNRTTFSSSTTSIDLLALNSSYPLEVIPVAGFTTDSYDRSAVVAGATTVTIVWSPFESAVTFNETGLPSGTTWSASVGSATARSSGTVLGLNVSNGTYTYQIGAPFTFEASAPSGPITISGSAQVIYLTFTLRPSYLGGTVTPANASLSVDGIVASIVGGRFNVTLLPGSHAVVASLAGFARWNETINTTAGNTTLVPIDLAPLSDHTPGGGSGGNAPASTWSAEEGPILVGIVGAVAVALIGALWWARGGLRQRKKGDP
ncbi:MAG: thermopsin [Thermoplasmata archaeon]|nr:thermopsin [Thermoplasmata archaeon]